jgi:acetyl-CoA carboxylase biotin carboxylase subunit
MLAKLIVWAATRDLAIDRMHRALEELAIVGVETSREFHLRLMEDPEFRRGEIEIQWLERRLPSLMGASPPEKTARAAAIAAALIADRDRGRKGASRPENETRTDSGSEWLRAGRLEGLR